MSKSKKKYYKVKVIQHLLKNNKMASSNDVVEGSRFPDLHRSIDGGFIVECDKDGKEIKEETNNDEGSVNIKKLNKENLIAYANENGYDIDPEGTKAEIVAAIEQQDADLD